jgi:hypothetical protein
MHEIIDRYPALVANMLPLQPPANPSKPRGHWHDLDTDKHESLMYKVQELINDCEEVRAKLHARDQLRGGHAPVGAEQYPASRAGNDREEHVQWQ